MRLLLTHRPVGLLGLAALGIDADRADAWRPWPSYALHHLWAAASSAPSRTRKEPS